MNDEAQSQKMAMALGMASFQAQALEYSLVSLHAVSFIENSGEWNIKIRKIMDTRYKQTLGKLIRDALSDLKISDDLREDLEKALSLRNWVTHHFFREYGSVGDNLELQLQATNRLNEAWPYLEEVASKIHQLVIERLIKSGQTHKQVEAGILRAIKKYAEE